MNSMFSIFKNYPELVYGFTGKNDGSMKIFDAENQTEDETHRQNKKNYFAKVGIDFKDLVQANLVAGNKVCTVSDGDKGKFIDNADALITSSKDIFLGITSADCFPIYFYNPENKTIALAHAGWRGIIKNIIGETLNKLDPDKIFRGKILICVGPGIRLCCYDIKDEVADEFGKDYGKFITYKDDKVFVDLPGVIKHQLMSLGISENHIEDSEECTYHSGKHFSWHKERDKMKQNMAYFGIK